MKKFYSRKDGIILTAIDILNEGGFQALSIREIAKRQDMAESLLYKNYKSKDEVVVAILKFYSKFDTAIMNTIQKSTVTSKQKIIDFISSYASYFQNYPAITSIVNSYEVFLHEEPTKEFITNIFKKRIEFVSNLIDEAQKSGELESIYTSDEFADIIIGFFRVTCLSWRINNFSYSLKDKILGTLDKLLN